MSGAVSLRRRLRLSRLSLGVTIAVLLLGGMSKADETIRVEASARSSLDALCEALGAVDAVLTGAAVEVDAQWPPSSPRGRELAGRLAACTTTHAGADRTLSLRVDREDLVASLQRASHRSWFERFFRIGDQQDRRIVRVQLDAELRQYVDQSPKLSATSVVARSMPLPASAYVGLSSSARLGVFGVLVATVDGVQLLRVEASRGRPRLETVESIDLPLASASHRRVVAQFSEASGGYYFQRTGEPLRVLTRGRGLRAEPVVDSPCDGGSFPAGDACVAFASGRDYFDSRLQTQIGEPAPPRASTSFYARFRQQVRRIDGTQEDVEVVVSPRGRVVARTGDRVVGAAGYGAGFAAGDVDDDGEVEVLATTAELVGAGDSLRLLRARADGSLHRVWSSDELEGSILHVTTADIDGDGRDEFLAIEERGPTSSPRAVLWVVR